MKTIFTDEYLKKNKKQRQLWNGEEFIINPYYGKKQAKKFLEKVEKRQKFMEEFEKMKPLTQDEKDEIQHQMYKRLALAL